MAVVNAQKPLSGARKAAIVMMALGEESSAKLLGHLEDHEIERIAREVASITSVPPELGEAELSEFHEMTAATTSASAAWTTRDAY